MTEAELIESRKREFQEGARVEAVNFVLDEGLRIWPIPSDDATQPDNWRVVRVADQAVQEELMVGRTFPECQAAYPDAVAGINDNESVPAGTQGTVRHVDDFGTVHVKWDNGRSIGVTLRDTIVLVSQGV